MERNLAFDALIGALCGAALGVFASAAWLSLAFRLDWMRFAPLLLFDQPLGAILHGPVAFREAAAMIPAGALLMAALAAALGHRRRSDAYGDAHFQGGRELRHGQLLGPPGENFLFGKLGPPRSRAPFLSGAAHPHCMMIAPTGAGKGVGFVIPNLLMFAGSTLTLDIKGENFVKTARRRAALGDTVLRFDPFEAAGRSHRYNPLARIAALADPGTAYTELARMAEIFLQDASAATSGGWLDGAKRLFIATALLAIERGTPSFGAILRLLQMEAGQKEVLLAYAGEITHPQAAGIFREYAGMPEKTLGSYLSVLSNAGGLGLWSNPAVDLATSGSDWRFEDFRARGHSLYLCVSPNDLKALAPLIRLILGQAVETLQRREPGPAERFPVMFMIDEFDQLGRMDLFVEAMKTLRSFGGRVMIVTQSTPGLDAIYGENARLSLEAAAGVKLWITPQDRKTAQELSTALGTRTRRAVSRSMRAHPGLFATTNLSEREEARPLLTPDDARRLDPAAIIILPAGQHPVKARRILAYADRTLAPILNGQTGPLPWPESLTSQDAALADASRRAVRAEEIATALRADTARLEGAVGELGARLAFIEGVGKGGAEGVGGALATADATEAAALVGELEGLFGG